MPSSGATKPEGATSFDGEEPTEVIALPRAPQKTIEMRVPDSGKGGAALKDEEGPDRTYLAPRAIPTQAVPDQGPADNKIVINVKTPAPSEVQAQLAPPDQPKIEADRARRRAPTVRIERGTLKAQGLLPGIAVADDGIDVSFDGDPEPPPDLRPRQEAKRAERGADWSGRDAATQLVQRAEKGSLKMVFTGIFLIVALGGGTAFALGYLGVVTIPGIPQKSEEVKPAPTTTAPALTTETERPQTARPTQTQTAESVVPPTSSAPLRPTTTPPIVKPKWVPPVTTRANPSSL